MAIRFDMGGNVVGAGTLISIHGLPYMVTALHVVDHMVLNDRPFKDTACHIDPYTNEEHCADIMLGEGWNTLVRVDRDNDVILLPLDSFPSGATPADPVLPGYEFQIGEEIWVSGCPTGQPNILTRGIVSGFSSHDRLKVFTDADTWFGTSGGGVFLSTGEYVGYFHSMVGTRVPGGGGEIAEGMNVFSPLPPTWGLH
tara:strand:- start:195 stop:788 length:594 start_codon:yes stop_codon:yes gene_type:complete